MRGVVNIVQSRGTFVVCRRMGKLHQRERERDARHTCKMIPVIKEEKEGCMGTAVEMRARGPPRYGDVV